MIGIGKGVTQTYGEVDISLQGIDIPFQVVDDTFPIKQDGIVGVSFLRKQEAIIKFRDKLPGSLFLGKNEIPFCSHNCFELPPRTRKLINIPLKNTDLKTGYIKKVNIKKFRIDDFVYIPALHVYTEKSNLRKFRRLIFRRLQF